MKRHDLKTVAYERKRLAALESLGGTREYEMALIAALDGDRDGTVALLQRAVNEGWRHLERFELRRSSQIPSGNNGDGLHQFSAQLEAKLLLLCGLAFGAALAHVLIERMRGKAGHHVFELLPACGEIDTREDSFVLIEKWSRTLQCSEYRIPLVSPDRPSRNVHKIGRASCREWVHVS